MDSWSTGVLNVDEEWWIKRHKENIRDFVGYVERYLAGNYPEDLLLARIADYRREYIETKPQ